MILDCGQTCGVPWQVIAAIAKVESNFGSNMATSSAGAIGYGQFLPSSWAALAAVAESEFGSLVKRTLYTSIYITLRALEAVARRRFTALTTAFSDAATMLPSMPTPQRTMPCASLAST